MERSHLFLPLQTPSKSFRHCSLPRVMRGVLWEVKSMSGTFKSSYGGKLFLHKCNITLNGLRANRYEKMKVDLFVPKDLIGL